MKTNRKNTRNFRHHRGRLMLTGTILLLFCILFFFFLHNRRAIPESLLSFGEKYPEAAQFVADYPKEKNKKHTIDVSSEVTPGTIPLFIQWDKRWGYEDYGSSCIGVSGCGPTSLSMILCGLTGDTTWNPYEVANFSSSQGYYIPGQGTSWELMTTGAELLGLNAAQGEIDAAYIQENLSASTPMICSMSPGDFTYSGHLIVLTGIDEYGNVIVNDPNSRKNSEKHWSMDVLLPQVKNIWKYQL